ncbi:MAG: hypothetical protein HQ503_08110 [Rhodospirillales bacterium]|nr:hypothetical protein [Rhodospirillales bacterium]
MDVKYLDTTFRDGSQSLWACNMRSGMMEAVAADMDRAGFDVIEVPANPIYFKKIVRDLKENPWDMMRMLSDKMPNTPKSCMGGGFNLNVIGTPTPPVLGKLFTELLVNMGVFQRSQMTCNTADQLSRVMPKAVPFLKNLGVDVAIAVSYSISPRHTNDHYAEKTKLAAELKPDAIYLKDQGGLLTVDSIRQIIPIMIENAGGIPIELHSHCTTGLAPLVYMEALKLGVTMLHTGVPPLAEGSAQPSVLSTVKNAELLGYSSKLDTELLADISARLMTIARADNMPIGEPMEYDYAQYVHQIPGGVISNLRFQLAEIGLDDRLGEVIEECIKIREELGYPVMITPLSQYIGTQAAINVATGARYKMVIDEMIRFAQGGYGEDSGAPWMDQNLKDKFLGLPRARELAEIGRRPVEDISLDEIRAQMGGAGVSDEELILRAIMQGTQEIEEMRAAGPWRKYLGANLPLKTLMQELGKARSVRYIKIQRGADSVILRNQVPA